MRGFLWLCDSHNSARPEVDHDRHYPPQIVPAMTVSSEQSRVQYATDGVATSFPVPFRFLSGQHLRVSFAQGDGDAVELVLGRDFDAVGVGNPSGGTITTYAAYPPGGSIAIERVVPITQETAYQRNDPFPERAHEQALDKLTMICQMLGGYFGLTPGSVQRALTLGKHDRDGRGAYRARNNRITDLGDPQTDTDAVNRRSMFSFVVEYVDRAIAGVSGGFGWFLQKGIGAIYRPFQDKMRDVVSVLDFITTPVDGTTSNQEGIEAAVAAAIDLGADLDWPAGTYVSTESISKFWAVKHRGRGKIVRGGVTFHISPENDEQSQLYVADSGSIINDGLSPETPTTMESAFSALASLEHRALDGWWSVVLPAGRIKNEGVRFPSLPKFKNRLTIIGPTVPVNSKPAAEWDGVDSVKLQALRSENNNGPGLFLRIKDVHFLNWDKGSLAGAILIWDASDTEVINVWVDDCAVGTMVRQSKLNVVGGRYKNCSTYGVAAQYGSTFDIGQLDRASGGVTFENCSLAASGSRTSSGYIKGSEFINCDNDIGCSRNSRVRPQNNVHRNWRSAAYDIDLSSVLTPDNGAGYPDTFTHTDPNATVYNGTSGSVHMLMQRGRSRTVHLVSNSEQAVISGASGSSVLLSSYNSTFVPFRLPRFALKSQDILIECELFVYLVAGAAGRLALNGDGPGDTTARLASIQLPSHAGDANYRVKFSVQRSLGSTQFRWTAEYQQFGLSNGNNRAILYGTANNTNVSAISQFSEDVVLFRLYWEPSSNAEARFYGMRSYIE